MSSKIKCPECKAVISLDESLAAPLLAAKDEEFKAELASKEAWVQDQRSKIAAAAAERLAVDKLAAQRLAVDKLALETKTKELEKSIEDSVAERAESMQQELRSKIEADKAAEVEALEARLTERNERLAEAQAAQVAALEKERALEDERREMTLTINKAINEKLGEARRTAKDEAVEEARLKLLEREATIAGMQSKIEDLSKKATQGSQQAQGEALEVALEADLMQAFPTDEVVPVPKGVTGADIIHNVLAPSGGKAGSIIWEIKRTRSWSQGWLAKLREDQRTAKADIAVIVTEAMPKDVRLFGQIEGVWVVSLKCFLPVATMLRVSILTVAQTRAAADGMQSKAELIYTYVTGPQFRARIEAVVESYTTMQEDLDKERRAITRTWAKREQSLGSLMAATVGTIGDLQGIGGTTIKSIPGTSLDMLEQ